MIRQHFTLQKYGWHCLVYYAVDTYYIDEILDKMHSIGCDGDMLQTAYKNMSSGNMNTGVTYSNFRDRETVMVITIHLHQKSLQSLGVTNAVTWLHISARLSG